MDMPAIEDLLQSFKQSLGLDGIPSLLDHLLDAGQLSGHAQVTLNNKLLDSGEFFLRNGRHERSCTRSLGINIC